ncbi:hypothetical protein Goshw_002707, partial [Gossypium schwendimanii]|nr:hypothetical protein [Gossypium schwendimanii]
MNLGDLHKVWEIKALKRKPGEEEAKKNLRENRQTSSTHMESQASLRIL